MVLPVRGIVAAFALMAWSGQVAAQEEDQVKQGRDLVMLYCADCHAVEATGASPLAGAPPFRELHLRYDVEFLSEALVEGIVTAHPEMPEFEFDPGQAAAIVTYLKTLEPSTTKQPE